MKGDENIMLNLKFMEIENEELNCGWCMAGGAVLGGGAKSWNWYSFNLIKGVSSYETVILYRS